MSSLSVSLVQKQLTWGSNDSNVHVRNLKEICTNVSAFVAVPFAALADTFTNFLYGSFNFAIASLRKFVNLAHTTNFLPKYTFDAADEFFKLSRKYLALSTTGPLAVLLYPSIQRELCENDLGLNTPATSPTGLRVNGTGFVAANEATNSSPPSSPLSQATSPVSTAAPLSRPTSLSFAPAPTAAPVAAPVATNVVPKDSKDVKAAA